MTRVLVTGATGFLGRHVVPKLVETGAIVTAHGRSASPFAADVGYVQGDLADAAVAAALLTPWRWDAVIDLAGPVTGGAEDLTTGIDVITAHVRIALHLRRHIAGARIVHASSMTVYGPADALPVREDHPRRPQHLYGLAKSLADDVLVADPALDTWIVRLPGLFSEQRRGGALFHFCRAARAGEPIHVSSPAPTVWDVLHVDDAADALVRAVSALGRAPGAINVSYGEPVELVAVARLIADISATGARVETNAVAHPTFQLDITKARQLLAWQPPTLRERLAKLYEDYATA